VCETVRPCRAVVLFLSCHEHEISGGWSVPVVRELYPTKLWTNVLPASANSSSIHAVYMLKSCLSTSVTSNAYDKQPLHYSALAVPTSLGVAASKFSTSPLLHTPHQQGCLQLQRRVERYFPGSAPGDFMSFSPSYVTAVCLWRCRREQGV